VGNAASCDPRFRPHLLEQAFDRQGLSLQSMRETILSVPVIVATTSTLQSRQEVLRLKRFSLCIVDEASQILEPSVIGLLAHPHVGRFVLVGDYKQLPAVVGQRKADTQVSDPLLRSIGLTDCRQSLFERLIRWEQQCGRQQFVGTLDHQGRMQPDVAAFPCLHFYADERLQPVPLQHQLEPALPYPSLEGDALDQLLHDRRVVFFGHQADLATEAHVVATLMERIYRYTASAFDADKTLGVIVTYRHQIALIRREVARLGIPELEKVSIDTVERYQGSQRDCIVYSFGVERRYQLAFLTANTFVENGRLIDRKLNVAMTRARRQLLMTGRTEVLRCNPLFGEIIMEYGIPWPERLG
jgi:superfamily I DNA and/or RNA helicase